MPKTFFIAVVRTVLSTAKKEGSFHSFDIANGKSVRFRGGNMASLWAQLGITAMAWIAGLIAVNANLGLAADRTAKNEGSKGLE